MRREQLNVNTRDNVNMKNNNMNMKKSSNCWRSRDSKQRSEVLQWKLKGNKN